MKLYLYRYCIFKGVALPVIPIKINYKKTRIIVAVYVDSGATYSILSASEAKRLGLEIRKGKLEHITVGDGGKIPVYLHRLKVQVGEERFMATIGFSQGLGIGFNILGQRDIFKKFKICFDTKNRYLTFSKPEKIIEEK